VLAATGPGDPRPTLASFDCMLDDTGNRTAIACADASSSTCGFDDANRLTSEHRRDASNNEIYAQIFAYDAVGNRVRMTGRNVVAYRAAGT
jgi:hypothetical protein